MNPLEARRRLLGRNVYKRTTEGNPAIAQGSLARRDPGITMQGWTEQDSTTGAQLFDIDGNELEPDTPTILRFKCHLVEGESYTITNNGNDNITFKISDYRDGYNSVAIDRFTGPRTFTIHRNENVPGSSEQFLYFWIHQGEQTVEVNDISMIKDLNIMINSGPEALPWEPYTGGAPSPSPDYKQDVKNAGKYNEESQKYEYGIELAGKNLLDIPDIESISVLGDIEIVVPCRFEHPVIVSMEDDTVQVTSSVWRIRVKTEDGTLNYLMDGTLAETFQASSENPIIEITYRNVNITAGAYRNIQVEYGDTATAYEPYRTPQTVTLTSDRPLTKWDKLEKRNGQWGWVYKSNEVVFDGGEVEAWASYNNGFYISGGLKDITLDTTLHAGSLSDKFHYDRTGDYAYFRVTNTGSSYSPIFYYSGIADIESWKQFLAENNVSYLYPTEAETFVPLSAEEQEAMNALYTFRPTTVLSNDAGCEMSLTYKTKKSLEVTT